MVRAAVGVLTVWVTAQAPALSAATVRVPSPALAKASRWRRRGVDSGADGKRGFDFAGFGIDDDQLLRTAAADEDEVLAGSMAMPTGLPRAATGQRATTARDLRSTTATNVLVLEVDVDLARAVGGEELRRAAELDGRVDLAGGGSTSGEKVSRALAVAGDGEDFILLGVVDNAVGVGQGGQLAEDGVGLEVEDDDGAGAAAVGNEAAVEPGHDSDAVRAYLPGMSPRTLPEAVSMAWVWVARVTKSDGWQCPW